MKTVLHVIDSMESGGAETVFVELADRMQARGYRTITVVPGEGWAYFELKRRNIQPIIIKAKGSFNLHLLVQLVKLARRENVNVIQSHLLGSNVYCGLAGFFTRTPVVATFHGMVDVSPNERFRRLKLSAMESGVNAYVAVSRRLLDVIHGDGLLNSSKAHVIYNGIDSSRYGRSRQGELRASLGLGDNATILGSLGNAHPAKGYEYLIRAARIVVDKWPDAHFVVAGECNGSLREMLYEIVEAHNLAGNIHFIGFVQDSARFLSQIDMFVLPSVSEGFSIVTLEALATGLPSVITRCGGPEEIGSEGEGLMFVEARDSSAIAGAILALLESPERSAELALAATAVARRFSLDHMVDSYVALYESVQQTRSVIAKSGRPR